MIKPTVAALALSALLVAGCASIETLDNADRVGAPKIYSGTRLDAHALAGNQVALRRFSAPPRYPLLDLPLSFALDTLVLPLTLPAACYEAVFY